MTTKLLSAQKPVEYAVAAGASTPDPGGTAARGAWAWSTTTGKPMYWDGSAWQIFSSSSAGTPGGAVGNIQYNDGAGGFGAEAALTYDSATNILSVEKIGVSNQPNLEFLSDGTTVVQRGTAFLARNQASDRWAFKLADLTAEIGSNEGSDIVFAPSDDSGADLGYDALTIFRYNGRALFKTQPGSPAADGLSYEANSDAVMGVSSQNINAGANAAAGYIALSDANFLRIYQSSLAGGGNATIDAAGGNLMINAQDVGKAIYFNTGGTTRARLDANGLTLPAQSDAATPAADNLTVWADKIAQRMTPAWREPDGFMCNSQMDMSNGYVAWSRPSVTTAIGYIGAPLTSVGTVSTPTLSAATKRDAMRRYRITSTTTAGALASHYCAIAECLRDTANGNGRWFYTCVFSLSTLAAGMRAFVGLVSVLTAPTNVDPTVSTTPGRIGIGINTNSGNWNLVHNVSGSAPTVTDLGANFPVNNTTVYRLCLYSPIQGTPIGYELTNLTTDNASAGTITTNLPASGTGLARSMWATNNATAAAVAFDCARQHFESN